MDVGLDLGDFVLDGELSSLTKKGTQPPIFGTIVAKRLGPSGYQLVRRWALAQATLC